MKYVPILIVNINKMRSNVNRFVEENVPSRSAKEPK